MASNPGFEDLFDVPGGDAFTEVTGLFVAGARGASYISLECSCELLNHCRRHGAGRGCPHGQLYPCRRHERIRGTRKRYIPKAHNNTHTQMVDRRAAFGQRDDPRGAAAGTVRPTHASSTRGGVLAFGS